jgi:hypothetical protein
MSAQVEVDLTSTTSNGEKATSPERKPVAFEAQI